MIARQQQPLSTQSSEAGFTLIESLLAIIVVTILMVGLAPVLVLSTATRVQAKRVEIGVQAVRSYIDGVKSGAIEPPSNKVETSPSKKFITEVANFPTPTSPGSLDMKAGYDSATLPKLYCIDGDGDGSCKHTSTYDMVIQAVRSYTPTAANADPDAKQTGYSLGLRVYRSDAFSDAQPLLKSDTKTKVTQSTFTGGTGGRKAPIVEMTTEMAPSQPKLQDLCDRLGCGK